MEQTVDRTGIPPTPLIPGFHTVARSAGRKALGSMLLGGDTTMWAIPGFVWLATPVATVVEVPCAASAVRPPSPQTAKPVPAITTVARM